MITAMQALDVIDEGFSGALRKTKPELLEYCRELRTHLRRALKSTDVFHFDLPNKLWERNEEVMEDAQTLYDNGHFKLPYPYMYLTTAGIVTFNPITQDIVSNSVGVAVYQPDVPRMPNHKEGAIYLNVFTYRPETGYGNLPFEFVMWMENGELNVQYVQFMDAHRYLALNDIATKGSQFANLITTLIVLLNSENVKVVKTKKRQAAPKKKGRKRKSGRTLPMITYHTVELDNIVTYEKTTTKDGEERRSPRLHYRRGHMRRYKKTGKEVWIEKTLIGKGELGSVEKEYEVKYVEEA